LRPIAVTRRIAEMSRSPTKRQARLERLERATEWPLTVLALALVPLLLVPWIVPLPPGVLRLVAIAEVAIWVAFAAVFVGRLTLTTRRLAFIKQNWFDALIVTLPLVGVVSFHYANHVTAAARVLRAVSALFRVSKTGRRFVDQRSTRLLAIIAISSITVAGTLAYIADRNEPDASIDSLEDGIWWAVTTVTTVGYGDSYPVTAGGRAVALALMLIGIAVFSGLTATVASVFAAEQQDETAAELRALREEVARLTAAIGARQEVTATSDQSTPANV
jgi:voltage-gated potassium channel